MPEGGRFAGFTPEILRAIIRLDHPRTPFGARLAN